jgi:hypothetical protein
MWGESFTWPRFWFLVSRFWLVVMVWDLGSFLHILFAEALELQEGF